MLFNSLTFLIFLPLVFAIYWLLGKAKKLMWQNLWLLIASYVFYGWWDYRFLALIVASTLVDYWVGLRIAAAEEQPVRKRWLWGSIAFNLGLLGFFKYYNFFVESWVDAFASIGYQLDPWTIQIILPVGISFYTFQTMSYSLDIYRRQLQPTRDFIGFAAFVSFFPQLVAGPIERASNLLPQILQRRSFSYEEAVDGSRQILWGFFMKVVIADNCGKFANEIFNNSADYPGSVLLLGAFFFAFQIYGDFAGYSNIAIGLSRWFGISLMKNFSYPYFSRDIAEFWRRWHISLSTWFRDYLYIPLGGSRVALGKQIRNVFIIFLVSGFWHGANWTFLFWGGLNAVFFLPLMLLKVNRNNLEVVAFDRSWPSFQDAFSMFFTFLAIVLTWIFFRAESMEHAFSFFKKITSSSLFTIPYFKGAREALPVLALLLGFILVEWSGRRNEYALEKLGLNWKRVWRWSFYYILILFIIHYSQNQQSFIYFQF